MEVMHARVTHVQLLPGTYDQAVELHRGSLIPAAQQQDGFQGLLLLADRSTGKGLWICLWDSEEAMKMGESSGYYQEQLAKFKDVFGAPPFREHYEVVVQA